VDVPEYAVAVAISGTHAFVANISGLQVIDITNPASPQIVGSVDTPGFANAVAVSGTHAYVADYASGLQVIDITSPASPQLVGSADTPGSASGVAVSGTYAYVADNTSGLQVLPVQCETGSGIGNEGLVAPNLHLHLCPNPGSAPVSVRLATHTEGHVEASVHDVAGRCVRGLSNEVLLAGNHYILWDGSDDKGRAAPAGIYFIRVAMPEGSLTARFVMVR
jgi:hypothetical protein